MGRPRTFLIVLGATAAAVAVVRHVRGIAIGRSEPDGMLMGDAFGYDMLSRLLLGPLFGRIADDVAALAPDGARVLDVGCGPGHLSIRLARRAGPDVTGLDLDPAMIERARANANRAGTEEGRRPAFRVGDVASLPFPDGSLDLVVSTLSMHHWADPTSALAEIGRVLRPGGRAIIWDFRHGAMPFHPHRPDPVEHLHGSALRMVRATPWHWPWRLNLMQRMELLRADGSAEHSGR